MTMHADEIIVDAELASILIATEFPDYAHLPLRPVQSHGTDHSIYRLGDELAVRFPRIPAAANQAERDWRWLGPLAPHLALKTPRPLAVGWPDHGYPYHWEICEWLDGENAFLDPPDDLDRTATKLAALVNSLRNAPLPAEMPPTGRGGPLAGRDSQTRSAIARLGGLIDGEIVTDIWELSLALPSWNAAPVWIHGDIHPGNLIVNGGEVSGIIDFGCLTIGDPATDLMIAWTMLEPRSRDVFRSAIDVDDATWLRGRGWALSVALIALPYYLHTNPLLVSISRHAIAESIADFGKA